MFTKKMAFFSLSLLAAASSAAFSAPNHKQIIVAPQCLLNKITNQTYFKVLAKNSGFSLIETNDKGLDQFIKAKHAKSSSPCGGFVNVTHSWSTKVISPAYAASFLKKYTEEKTILDKQHVSYSIKYPEQVNTLIKQLNPQLIWDDLTEFSNTQENHFPDRYANSNTGVKAANWLKEKIENMAKENHRNDITAYMVDTGERYKQPSLVVKIGSSKEPGVVIGGHMDTLSSDWEVKPGADDDGSGSMTVMGVARTLIQSGMHFKKPIYIIWYSAEEEGLVGSGYVVRDFVKKKIPVSAVLQFDMTGYANQNDPTLWLVTDHVDFDLTNYLDTLIKTYVKQPVGHTKCGYGCSDHASWDNAGFKASFPFEAEFNKDDPYIHTAQDTTSVLSLSHMTDYAKLGIAFAVELAEPV